MNPFKALLGLAAVALLGTMALPSARADTWNKKTVVTFSQAVEVPGKILPAGTYTFQLLDSPSDRHIVQIFNADGTQIITTILAINNYRLEPKGDTVMKFSERPGDDPEALRAWFYPGDNFGQEFAYPKSAAVQIAAVAHQPVPTTEATQPAEMPSAAVTTTPAPAEEPRQEVAQAAPPTQPEVQPAPAPAPAPEPAPQELPKTASPYPLVGLIGLFSVGLYFVLHVVRTS